MLEINEAAGELVEEDPGARKVKAVGRSGFPRNRRLARLAFTSKRPGVQCLSIRYTDRLLEAGVEPSVGSVGDSYDNAMVETVIGVTEAG